MSAKTPQVSVIIPVYNAESTLKQAIDSVINQSFTDYELILVDDGSKDGSYALLQEYARKDPRVRLIKNEVNLGLMKTLNKAIDLMQTDLIARVDADDEMLPTRLEKQKKFLDTHPDVAVVGTQYTFMGRTYKHDKVFPLPTTWEGIQQLMLTESPLCHSSVMMRKSALKKVGGYRDFFANAEDYDLWLRMSREFKLANLDEPLLRVRLSLGGASIERRWEMEVFRELAKESYRRPNEDLASLKKEIESRLDKNSADDYFYVFYLQLAKSLFVLGHYGAAVKVLFKYFKLWGAR